MTILKISFILLIVTLTICTKTIPPFAGQLIPWLPFASIVIVGILAMYYFLIVLIRCQAKLNNLKKAFLSILQNANSLESCPSKLKNNTDLLMKAVKQDSDLFKHASNELKSNKTFILKALNEGIYPWGLFKHASISIQSDIEVLTLTLEKSGDGWEFSYAQGDAALNKELAAKALVKFVNFYNTKDFGLWDRLHPTLQDFFPREGWHEKAQAYLYQLEQEKQVEMISGGCTEEDEVVW